MKKLPENFEKIEKLLLNLLIGSYVVNLLVLAIIMLSEGNVGMWLMTLVLPVALFYIAAFFIYIYRVIVFFNITPKPEIKIWRSVLGILVSPIGLLFTFFNYMVIVLANIW